MQHIFFVIIVSSVPDPDPYAFGLLDTNPKFICADPDPAPDPSINKQRIEEKPFCDFFMTSYL